MPKLKNVTAKDLADLAGRAFDLSQEAGDYMNRIEQGYCDDIPEPLATASGFLSVSRTLAGLSHKLLLKGELQEQKRTLEAQLRERQKTGT